MITIQQVRDFLADLPEDAELRIEEDMTLTELNIRELRPKALKSLKAKGNKTKTQKKTSQSVGIYVIDWDQAYESEEDLYY